MFSDEYNEHVGQPIAATKSKAKEELKQMENIIQFEGRYLTNSENSAHVCRKLF